ncbi:hypothetical protein JQS43_03805 [Natronosporangium hydrolyticum]|uniref:DUF5667 domain-containing protein n=1 Tax=Natronosporangium hydrolyticum TaxID=2811111 RepID=A0A895YN05_9ACTN|nr:hypothetical protein [Natronosporangium hydrolyticum]QSB15490.1 hypothetical protein JQS43_03805 [Natronosporangium hydrolyticum]
MNTKFVSKVIGGAALGTAVMLFGAPGSVSAAADDPYYGLEQTNVTIIDADAFGQAAEAVAIGTGDAVAFNLAAVIQVNLALDEEFASLACSYSASLNGEDSDAAEILAADEVQSVDDAIKWLEKLNGDNGTECEVENGVNGNDNGTDENGADENGDWKKDDKKDGKKDLKDLEPLFE